MTHVTNRFCNWPKIIPNGDCSNNVAYHNISSQGEISMNDDEKLFISNFKSFSELVEQQGPSFDIFWGMAKHLIES